MRIRPFALERFFTVHEFSVKYLACASDPETMAVRELLALEPNAAEEFANLRLGYTETTGSLPLRMAIASLYADVAVEDVLVHVGGEEPIFTFFHALLEPGDHVIAHFPNYQSLSEVAVAAGAEVSRWEARESDQWQLDPGELQRLLKPNTKVIVLNSPHNPTGAVMDRERLDVVVDFARRHGLWLLADEVYRGLELAGPNATVRAAVEAYERAVSVGAMAKVYGLAGLRIGWAASRDRRMLARMAAIKDYTTISAAGPSEFLAALALRHAQALATRARTLVTANVRRFEEALTRVGHLLRWVPPVGGPLAFPRWLGSEPVDDVCQRLLSDTGVLLLPGSVLEWKEPHFRLGLGRANFAEALNAMEQWLTKTFPRARRTG